ncbi:MAG: CPBP family intramembrane metalloprotease [Armatimonadetes bacterium]|nr:CPBP family intramembrane metalloprotease [Armatimonadota bacterium]
MASVVLSVVLFVGSAITSVWTERRPDLQAIELYTRFPLALTLLFYAPSLGWVWYCRTRFDLRSFTSLGLRRRRALRDALRGALTGVLAIGLLWSILWLTGVISVVGWSAALNAGLGYSLLALAGYALTFAAVGFFEETLFRGYALHNLNNWIGWKGAVAVQAVIFGLVHLALIFALIHLGIIAGPPHEARIAALGALPALILTAVFFALCYRKTGSLWFPIGFHAAWNFCLGCVFSLPVSGIETFRLLDVQTNQSSWLSGGSFGAEGSWLLLPILAALIFFISLAPDHPQAMLDLELLNRADEPATAPVIEEEEEDDMDRENRFRTKFGTSQGFSAETLRELRDLQEAREKQEREAQESARLTSLATSSFAPPVVAAPEAEKVEAAPIPKVETPKIGVEARPVEIAQPEAEITPVPVAPTPPAPPSPAKKPPSPRW